MDQTIQKLKHCDPRFYPYIEKVFMRLPEEVKERLLHDKSFQIMAGDDFLEACVLRYEFDDPVKKLLYLNTRMLLEPEHCLVYTIAHEVARYVIGAGEAEHVEKRAEELLIKWGFERELESFRYDRAIAELECYKIGYEWAKRQSREYVLRHFGVYFDEWNERGLRRMSKEQFERLQSQATTAVVAEVHVEPEKEAKEGALPRDEAIIAGIMAAVKEIKYHDACRGKSFNAH